MENGSLFCGLGARWGDAKRQQGSAFCRFGFPNPKSPNSKIPDPNSIPDCVRGYYRKPQMLLINWTKRKDPFHACVIHRTQQEQRRLTSRSAHDNHRHQSPPIKRQREQGKETSEVIRPHNIPQIVLFIRHYCSTKMKFIATSLLICQATAFTVAPSNHVQTRLAAGDYEPMEGEGKINLKVDLDSPKVATMDEIEKGKKVYCRCWLSGTFPLCDGA